jgi:cobalt-zinc-cadmium efflux system outer membrane protein
MGTGVRAQSLSPTGPPATQTASPAGGVTSSIIDQAKRAGAPPPAEGVPAIERLPTPTTEMPLPGNHLAADQGEDGGLGRAESVTLDELTRLMMASNPQIREAANNVRVAQGRAIQAGLYPNPVVQAASPQLAGNQTQNNVQLSQDYVTRNKIGLDSNAAWVAVRQAEAQLVRARFDALTVLRQRFYIGLVAQRRVEVLEKLVKIARDSRGISMKLLAAGQNARPDSIMLDIELDRAQVAWENAETYFETNKRQIAAAVGTPSVNLPRLAGEIEAELPKYDLIAVQRGVISRNSLVQIARMEIGRNEILLQRARVEPFPNINFQGGYQEQQPGAFAPQNQGLYQVTFAVPLWNRNQGNIRAAEANISVALAHVGSVENELANDAAAAIGRFLSSQQQVDRYEEQMLPKAREVLRLVQQQYAIGEAEFLRLLQAQRQRMEVELDYVNAQETRWIAAAEVAGLLQADQFP